jgi:hypothetical protein
MCTNYRPTARDLLAERLGGQALRFDHVAETFPGYAAPTLRRRAAASGGKDLECLEACFGLIPYWSDEAHSDEWLSASPEQARALLQPIDADRC